MLIVKQEIMCQFVAVHLAILEIHSLIVVKLIHLNHVIQHLVVRIHNVLLLMEFQHVLALKVTQVPQ